MVKRLLILLVIIMWTSTAFATNYDLTLESVSTSGIINNSSNIVTPINYSFNNNELTQNPITSRTALMLDRYSANWVTLGTFRVDYIFAGNTDGIYDVNTTFDFGPDIGTVSLSSKFNFLMHGDTHGELWWSLPEGCSVTNVANSNNEYLFAMFDIPYGALHDYRTYPAGDSIVTSWQISFGYGATPVPEPSTMLLLGGGLAGLAAYGKRRKRNKA